MKYLFIFLTTFVHAQSWVRLSDFPGTNRDDGIAVVVNNKLYLGTGMEEGWQSNRDFQVLDINNYTWSGISPMPPGAQRQYANAFAGNGSFFILGGDGPPNNPVKMYRYDIGTDTWAEVTNIPVTSLMAANSMVFGDKVIICGGKITSAGPCNNEVWEYTMNTNVWNKKNNLPFASRWRASSAVLNNKGYILFGIDDSSNFRKELYRYDHGTDVWNKISDFPGAGRAYAAMKADNKKLVVFGGYDKTNNFYNDTWYYFDSLNVWAQAPSLPGLKRRGDMSALVNGKFFISCGLGVGDLRLKETWVMDVPVGINEIQNKEFKIYPIPVKDFLYVNTNEQNTTFELYDVFGKKYLLNPYYNSSTGTYKIDLEKLQQGVYLLNLFNQEKFLGVNKIIKD